MSCCMQQCTNYITRLTLKDFKYKMNKKLTWSEKHMYLYNIIPCAESTVSKHVLYYHYDYYLLYDE